VLGVDDQMVFLDVARDVVHATPGFCWVGSARSGEEALDAVNELEPEFVLLDVRMPGMDGIETARRICDRHPDIVVVLISMEESPAMEHEIAVSGAATLVRKQEFGPAMLRRLWMTYRGGGD
jgi:two-component system, NarL family, invasion response regulator UvrY